MAGAPFFPSRHAEDVILVLLAAPAAHGRREQIAPLVHALCRCAFKFSYCSRAEDERVDCDKDK